MKSNICLVLTACIEVPDPSFVKRNQTAVRLRDYQRALMWWLTRQQVISKIIFCDNSGYPLQTLKDMARRYQGPKEIEFLSYQFTNYGTKGYGWGEIDIYRHVVQHSKLLPRSSYLAFCAGRRYTSNIESICRQLPADFDLIHNWQHNLSWAESDLFFVRTNVFTRTFLPLLKRYNNPHDQHFIHERAVAYASHTLINQDHSWYPLPIYPQYRGHMGSKDISLWWRKENYPWYNLIVSAVSRWHWRLTRTVYQRGQPHLLDRLKIRRPPSTLN